MRRFMIPTLLATAAMALVALAVVLWRAADGTTFAIGAACLLVVAAAFILVAARSADHRALAHLAGELERMASAQRAGDIDAVAQPEGLAAEGRRVVEAANAAVKIHVDNMLAVLEALTAYAMGDFTVSMKRLPGKQALANERIDQLRDNLARVTHAFDTAASQGVLAVRVDASGLQGDWSRLAANVNSVLDGLQAPTREATQVLERLAVRDLQARMTGAYGGEHEKMREALNATAEALHGAIAQVAQAVEQVSSSSGQIASSSQAVASGASEQAASLQETSASLESMASMTKQAADNAQQASALAVTAKGAATEGSAAVAQMTGAMAKIKKSAEGTSQIIKDINEIAFQTNLLALNAAVEAARAGEAGRGFAVVAEEVRSLALRSKEAANKTEELIRQSVREAGEGEITAVQVNDKLSQIVSSVTKVTDIVAEISAAAREQAAGIDQVTKAVAQMNQVTQQNAANSEESSSAAAELSGQSERLAAMVATFRLERSIVERAKLVRPARPRAAARASARPVKPGSVHANGKNGAAVLSPAQIIPLDDDPVFKDF